MQLVRLLQDILAKDGSAIAVVGQEVYINTEDKALIRGRFYPVEHYEHIELRPWFEIDETYADLED